MLQIAQAGIHIGRARRILVLQEGAEFDPQRITWTPKRREVSSAGIQTIDPLLTRLHVLDVAWVTTHEAAHPHGERTREGYVDSTPKPIPCATGLAKPVAVPLYTSAHRRRRRIGGHKLKEPSDTARTVERPLGSS